MRNGLHGVEEVMTATKKASQSCQIALTALGDVLRIATRWAAVSSNAGADAEEWLLDAKRAWMGAVKGFGGLLPGASQTVVILEEALVNVSSLFIKLVSANIRGGTSKTL